MSEDHRREPDEGFGDATREPVVEKLAESLYDAYRVWRREIDNVVCPRWFALRRDIKERFRQMADVLVLEIDRDHYRDVLLRISDEEGTPLGGIAESALREAKT